MIKIEFEFPDTGEGVTEGKFLEWEVEEGDEVEEDQVVGEAETDKAVVEIPAPADGKVESLEASPGDNVSVGDVIMELNTEESGEEPEEHKPEDPSESKAETDKNTAERPGKEGVLALPKVRKLAEEKGVELSDIKTGERIKEDEVLEAANTEDREKNSEASGDVPASPSVRKLARKKEVDIEEVNGSGRGGKITRKDVLDANSEASVERKGNGDVKGNTRRKELSSIQEKISERMTESRFTAPHVTHVEKADITDLAQLRSNEKDEVDTHLTYLPFIMKALVEALEDYPELNAELDEENNEIVLKNYYCFNIAVDTDRGLMIPKIKNVDRKSIVELAEEVEETADKARSGELGPDDMSNGSFSISNIGAIGGEAFTPIINYPQTAILGVGRISETAEVVDGELEPRMTVKLSLSYDHRVIDGATAARFMNKVVENLENPEKMLLNL